MQDTKKTLEISGWDRWQTFRKDRGTPSWIKVHRNLFSNPEWSILSDSEKGQLVSIWLLAADKNGLIPSESKLIQKMCMLDDAPNLNKFIDLGFLLSSGNHLVTSRPADGYRVVAQSREEESREEKSRVEKDMVILSPSEPTKTNYSESFNDFWSVYPSHRRGSKKRAFTNWKKISPDNYLMIIDHVVNRKLNDHQWLKDGGKFIIQAERFLSGERWEDGFQTVSKFSESTEHNLEVIRNIGDLNG